MASAQRETALTAQIAALDTLISTCDSEITAIDGETWGATAQVCATMRKNDLLSYKAALESRKTAIQADLTTLQTGWSAPRQTMVDDMNTRHSNKYDNQLVDLLIEGDATKQDELFDAYAEAANDLQRDTILYAIFGP